MEDDERGQGAGGVSTLPTVETQLPLTQFTEVLADTPVHFQLLDLGEQLMVWIGTGGARLENLSVAMPTKHDAMPTVATVLGDGTGSGDSGPMAQRLSKRMGRPVLVSLALPPSATLLQAVVERRLVEALGGEPPAAAAAAAALHALDLSGSA